MSRDDVVEPGPVRDLTAKLDPATDSIVIKFTSPADDADDLQSGRGEEGFNVICKVHSLSLFPVQGYEIRFAESRDDLVEDFESATLLDEQSLQVDSDLETVGAGEAKSLRVQLQNTDFRTIFSFGVKAYDESFNRGSLSNVVDVAIEDYVAPEEITDLEVDINEAAAVINIKFTSPGDNVVVADEERVDGWNMTSLCNVTYTIVLLQCIVTTSATAMMLTLKTPRRSQKTC